MRALSYLYVTTSTAGGGEFVSLDEVLKPAAGTGTVVVPLLQAARAKVAETIHIGQRVVLSFCVIEAKPSEPGARLAIEARTGLGQC